MYSYYKGGIKTTTHGTEISFDILQALIKSNPHQEAIATLRKLEYGSDAYKKYKRTYPFPIIKPHGTFKNINNKEHVQSLSGYLYFDVDASDLNSPLNIYKEFLLQDYSEYISMMGTSIGGAGLFFLCKVKGITADNFSPTHEYFRTNIFQQIPIDENALGISRSFFIPYDNNLYINKNIETDIKNINFNTNEKCIGQCIYTTPSNVLHSPIHFTAAKNVQFLPIDEVLNQLQQRTIVNTEGKGIIEKPADIVKLFVEHEIPDGEKHSTFRNITNVLVHLNPDAELLPILSFLNWVNQARTGNKSMSTKEMIRTVTAAYEYSKLSGLWNPEWAVTRWVHFDRSGDKFLNKAQRKELGKYRTKEAQKRNARRRKEKSLLAIEIVVQELKLQGIKPTIVQVAEILEGRLSICTVKKYWRVIIPKIPALPEQQIQNTTKYITMKENPYTTVAKELQGEPTVTSDPIPAIVISFTEFQKKYHKEHYPFQGSVQQIKEKYFQLLKTGNS